MGVVMKGGTSGNRKDGAPPASPSFDKQEMENTAGVGGVGDGVVFTNSRDNRHVDGTPRLPAGGKPDDRAT
jgi:hypothetical protein